MAAKDSDTKPASRRSCFLTACITRFSLAAFLRLLLLVPCTPEGGSHQVPLPAAHGPWRMPKPRPTRIKSIFAHVRPSRALSVS